MIFYYIIHLFFILFITNKLNIECYIQPNLINNPLQKILDLTGCDERFPLKDDYKYNAELELNIIKIKKLYFYFDLIKKMENKSISNQTKIEILKEVNFIDDSIKPFSIDFIEET